MKTYSSILDLILDTPTQGSKTASLNIGDAFLDADTRGGSGVGAWHNKQASSLSSDSILGGAVSSLTTRSKVASAAGKTALPRFKSIADAVKFAASLEPTPGAKLSAKQQKVGLAARKAASRLSYLLNRPAALLKQDGAASYKDYLDAARFPKQAAQIGADMRLLNSIRQQINATRKAAAVTKSDKDVMKERTLGDIDPKAYVKGLLNDGYSPKEIDAKIEKMAELQGFTKSLMSDALKENAGVIGLAYLEPNHYMNDCSATAERLQTKMGGTRAKSVRQIKACSGCQNFRKSADGKSCSLYRLPIVSSQNELMPIINNLTGSSKNKRARLIEIANREDTHHQPKVATKAVFSRTAGKAHVPAAQKPVAKKAASFHASDVLSLYNAGQKLSSIYAHGEKIVGPLEARIAVKKFVAGLKGTKTKIALTQIDCTNLGSKLSSSNAIYGEKKCASCTYRQGAHCGLTGGTLVAYPGMDMRKSNHRIASGAPVDGMSMIEEFDMLAPKIPIDIEFLKPGDDVSLTGFSKVEL